MKNLKVNSREYKIMLDRKKFMGDRAELIVQCEKFWSIFEKAIVKTTTKTTGTINDVTKQRWITFFDTKDHLLNNNRYIFRKRIDLLEESTETTFKFRHPDRFIAQDRDMSAKKKDKGESKFEEDIKALFKKPSFMSLYSFSTKQSVSNSKSFETLKDIDKLYPDLSKKLSGYDSQIPIEIVNNFHSLELVIEGGSFYIGKDYDEEIECALVVWYKGKDTIAKNQKLIKKVTKPAVVEFSFKYKDDKSEYSGQLAQDAYDILETLQYDRSLKKWVNSKSLTKTASVYQSKKEKAK